MVQDMCKIDAAMAVDTVDVELGVAVVVVVGTHGHGMAAAACGMWSGEGKLEVTGMDAVDKKQGTRMVSRVCGAGGLEVMKLGYAAERGELRGAWGE